MDNNKVELFFVTGVRPDGSFCGDVESSEKGAEALAKTFAGHGVVEIMTSRKLLDASEASVGAFSIEELRS